MFRGLFSGVGRLQQHLPWLRSARGRTLGALGALIAIGLPTAFLMLVDRYFAEWLPDGEIVVLALGFLILSRFFSQRPAYQARYGEQAYARALAAFGFPGLGIVFAAIAHLGYIPGPEVPPICWRPALIGAGWIILAVGILMWYRAVNALGIDYLTMLYVYHPQDRRMIRSSLFSVLRHPTYAAAIHISVGLACVHANWYALLVALIVPLFFVGWIHLVEEKELLALVKGYTAYRKSVPALAPRLGDLGRYWRVLITGA